MAGGSNKKQSSQDRFLRDVERVSRNSPKTKPVKSLKEQIDDMDAYNDLSDSEKIKRMSKYDWEEKVIEKCKGKVSSSRVRGLFHSEKDKMAEFHKSGAPFSEVANYLEDIPDMGWL